MSSGEAKDDLDLVSRATGLLTIEIAFLLVFFYGHIDPANLGDIAGGFWSFRGIEILTTILIASALVAAILSSAAALSAVLRDTNVGGRLVRMSAGLLGFGGLVFVVHVLLRTLAENEWTNAFVGGLATFAFAIVAMVLVAWRVSRPRV